MSTFVVPDIHGNWKLALSLLEQEGLIEITEDGKYLRLLPEVDVVQLGDLCNCVAGSINDDMGATVIVGPIINRMLVGNHEHPYFGGPPFDGFAHYAELKEAILKLNDRGLIQAAHEVDGILLTHAGMTRDADSITDWKIPSNKAREAANGLNYMWTDRRDYRHAMFSAIGKKRGGIHPYGGVLWSDWSEPKCTLFPQIVGHTVGKTWRYEEVLNGAPNFNLTLPTESTASVPAQTLCIDIGAGKKSKEILGCWITDGEVKIVSHKMEDV